LQVLEWINELVSQVQPKLMTPPPVLSRVYQELSNGMLGFNQSLKLADVPFPFIFAQILEAMLTIFLVIAPLVVVVITGVDLRHWLTPFATSVVVMSFWSLNEMAKELENPFGDDVNDVPIANGHERFVEALTQVYYASIPEDQQFVWDEEKDKRENPPKPVQSPPPTPSPPPLPPTPLPKPPSKSPADASPAPAALTASAAIEDEEEEALAMALDMLVDRLGGVVHANTCQMRELQRVLEEHDL